MNYKHYIKINENNEIILSFSNWQKCFFDGSEIFIKDSKERHHQLDVIENPEGKYPLKYINGKIIENA